MDIVRVYIIYLYEEYFSLDSHLLISLILIPDYQLKEYFSSNSHFLILLILIPDYQLKFYYDFFLLAFRRKRSSFFGNNSGVNEY